MIVNFEELENIRKKHKDQKIIFCGGVFDLLHNGHVQWLKDLKEMGDILIVTVSSDKRVKERKGQDRPIHNQDIRLMLIDAIRYVDYSFIAPEPDSNFPDDPPTMRILNTLRPNVFVPYDSLWKDYEAKMNNLGVELVVRDDDKINSTTDIIKKIRDLA